MSRLQPRGLWEEVQTKALGSVGRGALVTHRLSWLAILSPVTLGTILALKG